MSEHAGPSRRRRFRLSSRAMFVGVAFLAVIAAWLGCQLNWIRERNTAKNRAAGIQLVTGVNGWFPKAPWPLWIFGEKGYAWILLHFPDPDRLEITGSGPTRWEKGEPLLTSEEGLELARMRRLFPETLCMPLIYYRLNGAICPRNVRRNKPLHHSWTRSLRDNALTPSLT